MFYNIFKLKVRFSIIFKTGSHSLIRNLTIKSQCINNKKNAFAGLQLSASPLCLQNIARLWFFRISSIQYRCFETLVRIDSDPHFTRNLFITPTRMCWSFFLKVAGPPSSNCENNNVAKCRHYNVCFNIHLTTSFSWVARSHTYLTFGPVKFSWICRNKY